MYPNKRFSTLLLLFTACILVSVEKTASTTAAGATRRPNMVLIVTDQERAPPTYEDETIKAFRQSMFPGYQELGCSVMNDADSSSSSRDDGEMKKAGCIQFHRHYTASTACRAARAHLYTGQYASLHGINDTDGMGKRPKDVPELPLDIPTMGHYFQAAGYVTKYIGKWHLSHENIGNQPTRPLDGGGDRDVQAEAKYLEQDKLSKYGFHGWVGPEPHGQAKANTGMWRDPQFVEQAIEFIQSYNITSSPQRDAAEDKEETENEESPPPFLLVFNLVNPHDISLWNAWRLYDFPFTNGSVPVTIPEPPTFHENLEANHKPSQQSSWKKFSQQVSPRKRDEENYRQFYYYVSMLVDEHIATIVRTLKNTQFWENTIVVRTSDHGELLGAHGLYHKWYQAYEEAMRIPFMVSSPLFVTDDDNNAKPMTKSYSELPTSSVDILPTILSLAGLNATEIRENQLQQVFQESHPLVGTDLSNLIMNPNTSNDDDPSNNDERGSSTNDGMMITINGQEYPTAIYSAMSDHISHGGIDSSGIPYHLFLDPYWKSYYPFEVDEVQGPSSMEMVVAALPNNNGGEPVLWKLVRSYDEPSRWTEPNQRNVYIQRNGILFGSRGQTIIRTEPLPDEWELYNLSEDPTETNNLAANKDDDAKIVQVQKSLTLLMNQMRREKCLERNTPLPKVNNNSTQHEEHLSDLSKIVEEKMGAFRGRYFVVASMMIANMAFYEPMLLRFCFLVGFTFFFVTALLLVLLFVRSGKNKNKLYPKQKTQ